MQPTGEAEIVRALAAFFDDTLSIPGAAISSVARISDGWECDTYSFTLEALGSLARVGGLRHLILRLYPGGFASVKAAREFTVMRWLYGQGYPVPEVFAIEPTGSYLGSPFILMQKIDGRPLWSVISESSITQKLSLIRLVCRLLVNLHSLDWRPFAASVLPQRPIESVDSWLSLILKQANGDSMKSLLPVVDWLRARSAEVGPARLSLLHWDFHPNNVLYRPDGAAFVIDWTQPEVNDFRFDLAWTLLLTGTFEGWAMREAILWEYERLAGKPVEHVEYFEVIAAFRRLYSIVASLAGGAASLGMRPGAEAQMRSQVRHLESVYVLLSSRTGIDLPSVERLLTRLAAE